MCNEYRFTDIIYYSCLSHILILLYKNHDKYYIYEVDSNPSYTQLTVKNHMCLGIP